MKQETLEEDGLKHCNMLDKFPALVNPLFSFNEGAKCQQENSYSELELFINEVKDKIDLFEHFVNQKSYISEYLDEWFEKYKKK